MGTVRAWLRRVAASEHGFSMIEVVVALSLLGLVGSGFSVGLTKTLLLTQDDRLRQQATHIAERELEIARNRFQHSDENGQLGVLRSGTKVNDEPLPGQTAGQPVRVDGRDFTVTRVTNLITNGTGANPCEGSGAVTYLSLGVVVRVTWNQGGEEKSVENRTILTPQKGVEGDAGFLAAKVTDADGKPLNNLSVQATGPGGTAAPVTTVDGCAVFEFSTAGSYTLTLNQSGYVNYEGYQSVSKTANLELGKLNVLPFTYDKAAAANVTYVTAPGYPLPQTLPGLTLFNSGLVGGKLRLNPTAAPASVTGLWPYPTGYSIWASTCDQSDPALNSLGYPRPDAVYLDGGKTTNASVALHPVDINVVNNDGDGVGGVGVKATRVDPADIGCLGNDAALELGTSSAGGDLKTSLPAGVWTLEPVTPFLCETEDDTECPVDTPALVVVEADGSVPSSMTPVSAPDLVVKQ